MWVLLVMWMGLQTAPCPESVIAEAQALRDRQGRQAEMAFLERRLAGCVPTTLIRFETANRYIEWSESMRGDKRQSEVLEKGFEWARSAVRADPTHTKSHEILATAYGAKIHQSGPLTQMRLADSVRVHALNAVELDPRNATALHILGRWHHELSRLGWMTSLFSGMVTDVDPSKAPDIAHGYFLAAVQANATIQNLYWLGKSHEGRGETRRTRELYRSGVDTTPLTEDERRMREEMRTWLRMNPR